MIPNIKLYTQCNLKITPTWPGREWNRGVCENSRSARRALVGTWDRGEGTGEHKHHEWAWRGQVNVHPGSRDQGGGHRACQRQSLPWQHQREGNADLEQSWQDALLEPAGTWAPKSRAEGFTPPATVSVRVCMCVHACMSTCLQNWVPSKQQCDLEVEWRRRMHGTGPQGRGLSN